MVCCYLIGAVAVAALLWADPAGREQFAGVGDNELFSWFLRYAATAVAHGRLPALVTTAMNAPQGVNLMWNTSFLLPGVLLTPVTLLAGPQVSLTLTLTLGFAGSAASLFWVLRRWGASLGAAALGGAVYGFSPALVNAGFAHYHLQFAVLPPLIIDAVARLITGRGHRVRVGAWLGLLCAAQLFIGEELLTYTALACLVLAAVIALSRPRAVPRRARDAVTGLAAAVAIFLLADGYALWVQFFGPLAEHSELRISATAHPAWFVTPSATLLFHTRASAAATPRVLPGTAEDLIYLGWPLIVVLLIAAAVFWRDVRVRAAAVVWAVLEMFGLGGASLRIGHVTWPGRLLPWHWLQGLPGLAQVLPWRVSILGDAAAGAALAFALDRALAAAPCAAGKQLRRGWPRGVLAGVALLAVMLRLPPDAPVLALPFPGTGLPDQLMRWQADTGWPQSIIGGYFLGPSATGQASFYFSHPSPETAIASYLNKLWKGQHPPSPPSKELQAVFHYWRPAAIVVVAGQQSPAVRVLTQLFGRPAFHIGQVGAAAGDRGRSWGGGVQPASRAPDSSLENGRVARAAADDLGLGLGEVDDRRRLGPAVAGVDHRVHGLAELFGDFPALGHRLVLAGQQQGAGDQRLAKFGEQRLGRHVVRDPHPDRLLPRVLEPARHLLGRRKDERVTAGGRCLDRPEHPVGNVRELAELGEVLAHQREVVPAVELADSPDPRDAVAVAELAPECVAGVRRVGDDASRAHDLGDLGDRPGLRVGRMNVKVPGYARSVGSRRYQDQRLSRGAGRGHGG